MKRFGLGSAGCLLVLLLAAGQAQARHKKPTPVPSDQYDPVNQAELVKTASYELSPLGFVNTRRRKAAYKSMWSTCSGKYVIVQEYDKVDGVATVDPNDKGIVAGFNRGLNGGNDGARLLKSHCIEYRCVPSP